MQRHAVRRTHIVRAPSESTTLWPSEFVEVELPPEMAHSDSTFAVEPHPCSSEPWTDKWPTPSLLQSVVAGKLHIPNLTNAPRHLKRYEHFCKVRTAHQQEIPTASNAYTPKSLVTMSHIRHSNLVQVDPDNMLRDNQKAEFRNLFNKFDNVFNPSFKGYNGAVGPLEAKVNMGTVQPPQRKGRVPQNSKNQLDTLQQKFYELENIGVFKRPEDVGITVEYVNPSFLIKKPNGSFRLVTAFADVGRYSKAQPSLMPDIASTLRQRAH